MASSLCCVCCWVLSFGWSYFYFQQSTLMVIFKIFRLQETLDLLAAKLESVYKASGGKKINIISHSMGGLLVKCFMCLHTDVKFQIYFSIYLHLFSSFPTPFTVKLCWFAAFVFLISCCFGVEINLSRYFVVFTGFWEVCKELDCNCCTIPRYAEEGATNFRGLYCWNNSIYLAQL